MKLPQSKFARVLLAIVGSLALIFGGVGIASAASSSSAGPPVTIYGCVVGSSRTLEHVYTNQQNFLNSGGCVGIGGFEVTVGANGTVTPTPTPTTPTPTPTQTTPTPTPTPTTPTPTPTQTQTTPPPQTTFSESCAAKTSTSAAGCGGINLGPTSGQAPGFLAGQAAQANLIDVQPDGWSGSQGPATVAGNSYQSWTATETDTPPQANSAQILTYPSTTFNYYNINTAASGYTAPPAGYDINNLTNATSTYSEQMPPVSTKYTAENAYDIWLNNWDTEVMIWTDVHYQGVDCGGPTWTPECSGSKLLGNFTYNGQQWSLYANGTGINGFYMWIPDNGEALDAVSQSGGSGTVDIGKMLQQTATSGGFTADAPLTQIGYGWEVADTGGVPLNFTMKAISVSLSG